MTLQREFNDSFSYCVALFRLPCQRLSSHVYCVGADVTMLGCVVGYMYNLHCSYAPPTHLPLQSVDKNDSVDVKYTGWIMENNTFGKVKVVSVHAYRM